MAKTRGRKPKNPDSEVYTTRIRTTRIVQRALALLQARRLAAGGQAQTREQLTAELLESWAAKIMTGELS